MPARRLLYIESDGQVYLVPRDGVWTFPSEEDSLPFEFDVRHSTKILDVEVAFCRPRLTRFPAEWVFKDDVPLRTDVDPIVQRAINASLTRCVVGALIFDGEQRMLVVKSNRGFTKGVWNIPGGFIEYGERPEDAIVREVAEETGLTIEVGSLLGVFMERFQSPYFMYGFMFEARNVRGALRIEPSEIEAAQWMPWESAARELRNPFALQALELRFRGRVPRPVRPRHGAP
jgi:ADP-ribose pyrophosphatase YjhB (NUDIX family)